MVASLTYLGIAVYANSRRGDLLLEDNTQMKAKSPKMDWTTRQKKRRGARENGRIVWCKGRSGMYVPLVDFIVAVVGASTGWADTLEARYIPSRHVYVWVYVGMYTVHLYSFPDPIISTSTTPRQLLTTTNYHHDITNVGALRIDDDDGDQTVRVKVSQVTYTGFDQLE